MLALVHISARHFVPEILAEAREEFPATEAPRDFDLIELPLPERGGPVLRREGALEGSGEPEPLGLTGQSSSSGLAMSAASQKYCAIVGSTKAIGIESPKTTGLTKLDGRGNGRS